jgi:hypothetical protein
MYVPNREKIDSLVVFMMHMACVYWNAYAAAGKWPTFQQQTTCSIYESLCMVTIQQIDSKTTLPKLLMAMGTHYPLTHRIFTH